MPFGLAVQCQTQEMKDRFVDGLIQGKPIPMSPEKLAVVDGNGDVVSPFIPSAPMFPSRKAFAQAIMLQEFKEKYVAHKTQMDSNAAYDASRAVARAAVEQA